MIVVRRCFEFRAVVGFVKVGRRVVAFHGYQQHLAHLDALTSSQPVHFLQTLQTDPELARYRIQLFALLELIGLPRDERLRVVLQIGMEQLGFVDRDQQLAVCHGGDDRPLMSWIEIAEFLYRHIGQLRCHHYVNRWRCFHHDEVGKVRNFIQPEREQRRIGDDVLYRPSLGK